MVERITGETFRTHLDTLKTQGLLTLGLGQELERIREEMDGFSNWLDARKHLMETGATHLSGSGPISKFLRTLTYALERMVENRDSLENRRVKLDKIQLSNTTSGCSDFRGTVQIFAVNEQGDEMLLWDGGFHWDCAEHGMPQPEAAQSLGYRCMIQFPDLDPAFSVVG